VKARGMAPPPASAPSSHGKRSERQLDTAPFLDSTITLL
jgi:hypothetical protein